MINISDYADPNFEALRIGLASGGDPERLDQIKSELRDKHDRGLCQIWHLDDELAIVAWADKFVITITDTTLVSPQGGS
jgi:hypothetical protein